MSGSRAFSGPGGRPRDFGPCATTIGNFDGVHVGHQALMRRVPPLRGSVDGKPPC